MCVKTLQGFFQNFLKVVVVSSFQHVALSGKM